MYTHLEARYLHKNTVKQTVTYLDESWCSICHNMVQRHVSANHQRNLQAIKMEVYFP